ncbi:unnamed protein product [Owenia fusiformis]|uniref:Uncharacterized protein n=1 Tax=Owenia fusiformis TaxID=6347 RepID=A0A8S4PUL0_OWEFU|nr:unnamed protein product [Owenia fusiformis]
MERKHLSVKIPQVTKDTCATINESSIPSTAAMYDVDTEYEYIMQKALRSYHTHEEQEPSGESPVSLGEKRATRGEYKRVFLHKECARYALPPRPLTAPCRRLQDRRKKYLKRPDINHNNMMAKNKSIVFPNDIDPIIHVGRVNNRIERTVTSQPTRLTLPGQMDPSFFRKFSRDKSKERPKSEFDLNGFERKNSSENGQKSQRPKSAVYEYGGGLFKPHKFKKPGYFTIHPDWVSESLSVQRLSLQERTATFPPRRCKSAPPPIVKSRNPITWEFSKY